MRIDTDAREFILTAWSQILRRPGRQMGYDLNPITSSTHHSYKPFESNFRRLLQDNRPMPIGAVVSTDLEAVAVNLGSVPLDEVLDFKRSHGKQYLDYRRELNRTVATLSVVSEEQSKTILADRSSEFKERAEYLTRQLQKSFSLKSVGSFSLGLVGAAWGIRSGNIPAASVGVAGALWALTKDPTTPASILYLASIKNELSR